MGSSHDALLGNHPRCANLHLDKLDLWRTEVEIDRQEYLFPSFDRLKMGGATCRGEATNTVRYHGSLASEFQQGASHPPRRDEPGVGRQSTLSEPISILSSSSVA